MIVRALDGNHDWTFGKGKNDYKSGLDALAQSLDTRLSSFLGDCFFDQSSGIDWFNLLGAKSEIAVNLAVRAVISNTPNVTGILEVLLTLDETSRLLTIKYKVQTTFGSMANTYQYDFNNV